MKLLKYSLLNITLTSFLLGIQGFSSFKIAGSAEVSSRAGTGQADISSDFSINPALNDGKTSMLFTHGILLLNSYMNSMTFKSSFWGINSGISFFYFNSGKIEYIPDESASQPKGYYSVFDISVRLNFVKQWNNFSLGISPFFYMESMLEYSGSGYGMDFGFYYAINKNVKMGVSLLNWSGKPFLEGSFLIAFPFVPPFIANAGVSVSHKFGKLPANFLADFSYDIGMNIPSFKLGYTVDYKNMEFSFGYRFLDSYAGRTYLLNSTYGPSFGIALRLFKMKISYSFQYMYSGFNPIHKISLKIIDID